MKRENGDYRVPKVDPPEEEDSLFVPIILALLIVFLLSAIGLLAWNLLV